MVKFPFHQYHQMPVQELHHLTPFGCMTIHIHLMKEKLTSYALQVFCFRLTLHDFLPIKNKALPPLPECLDKALFHRMTEMGYLTLNPTFLHHEYRQFLQ